MTSETLPSRRRLPLQPRGGPRETHGVRSKCVIGDNRKSECYGHVLSRPADFVVAHPPYLNSFNYLHAFSLEFIWSEGLLDVWDGWTLSEVQGLESRAWPATDQRILDGYYADLGAVGREVFAHLGSGGVLSLVIGDATIHGELEPVIRKTRKLMEEAGFASEKTWFRTTHYGIGKYAYSHRADYHGEAEKRDGVLFFRRP